MKFVKLFLLLVTISFSTGLFGQLKETVHQTFEIDEAQSINLDLAGDFEIVKWAGNTLMSKTYIELSDARPSILNYYLKDGRYELEGNASGDSFSLVAKDKNRRPIKYKNLTCYEYTKVVIYVPDDFVEAGKTSLVRQSEDQIGASIDQRR